MAITKKDVLYVADLARLELTPEEAELYTGQLQRILTHMEKLSALDTAGVEPLTAPPADRLREDGAAGSLPHDEALKNAPSSGRDCFKVPQIIE